MTIVTNQGDVRYISKGEHFDYNGAVELMRECQENIVIILISVLICF